MFDDTDNGVTNYDLEAENAANKEEVIEQTEEQKVASDREKNLATIRLEKDKLARELEEQRRKNAAYEEIIAATKKQPQIPTESDEIKLGDDELAEGKHLAKVSNKIRKLEDQLKQYQQVSTEQTIEAQIKAQYPDFDKVVTKDTIEQLKNDYPDIAATINTSPDLKSKAITAYTLMKKLGIYTEDIYEKDRLVAQKNSAKPRPVNSISPQQGETPLSRANAFANGLTEDLQKALHKEMIEAMKNR
jgi:hypothetical protein